MKTCDFIKELETASISARGSLVRCRDSKERLFHALVMIYCLYEHLLLDGLQLSEEGLNNFLSNNEDLVNVKDLLKEVKKELEKK